MAVPPSSDHWIALLDRASRAEGAPSNPRSTDLAAAELIRDANGPKVFALRASPLREWPQDALAAIVAACSGPSRRSWLYLPGEFAEHGLDTAADHLAEQQRAMGAAEVAGVFVDCGTRRPQSLGAFASSLADRLDCRVSLVEHAYFGLPQVATELFAQLLKSRQEHGAPEPVLMPELAACALRQAAHIARTGVLSHVDSDAEQPRHRIQSVARRALVDGGEVISLGSFDAHEVIARWAQSETHKPILLGPFTHCGVAAASLEKGSSLDEHANKACVGIFASFAPG